MKLCLDTWYFLTLAGDDKDCKELLESGCKFVVPSITLFEIIRKSLQKGKPEQGETIRSMCVMLPFVTIGIMDDGIADVGARYSHSLGLSTADALILATAKDSNCDYLISKDPDFEIAEKQNIIKLETPTGILNKLSEEKDKGDDVV